MAIKINLVVRLQHWMDSVPGQTFLNYAYSWGASIVILGALFKLTHLPGSNLMLFIGMGTEVIVFFLSAFDRPFDKNEAGKELPADYETDEEIAARLGLVDDEEQKEADENDEVDDPVHATAAANPHLSERSVSGVAPVVNMGGGVTNHWDANPATVSPHVEGGTGNYGDATAAAQGAINALTPEGSQPYEAEAQRLAAIIRAANDELLHRAQAVLSPEMEEATQTYISKLQALAETFAKVDEQSARLAKDSEEMENLNRTLTGINKVYELHLKGISLQVGTIDQINGETKKLAQQIEELNGVYGRMIQALTVNMRGTTPSENK